MKAIRNQRMIIGFFVVHFFFTSCQEKCEEINFLKFNETTGTPLLHIIDKGEGCKYLLEGEFSVDKFLRPCTGLVEFKENMFLFEGTIDTIKYKSLQLFDLSQSISKISSLVSADKEIGRMKLDSIFKKAKKEIFQFRIIEGMTYEGGALYDLVFFVTRENFIIGSYVSRFEKDGTEIVISEKGDILKDKIDYKKKKMMHLL